MVALLSGSELETLTLDGLIIETGVKGMLDQNLHVIGYPVNLGTQLSTDLERRGLIRLLDLIPADIDILKPLNERNSPSVNIQVISLEGHLLPGHSGAPIFNRENRVIGVSNGGLASGTIEISWGILWQEIKWKPVSEDRQRFEELKQSNPFLFSFTTNQTRIILEPKEVCRSAIGYESISSLKRDLFKEAKQAAAEEFLSRDYVQLDLSIYPRIRSLAIEYVRITGSEQYRNDDKNLAEVCVEINPYFTEEEKKALRPLLLTKRACIAIGEQTFKELQEEAKKQSHASSLRRI